MKYLTKHNRTINHIPKADEVEYSLYRVADLLIFNWEKDDLFDYDEIEIERLKDVAGGGIPDRAILLKRIMDVAAQG